MTETLLVLMGDATAEVLTRSRAGKLHFSYDDDYKTRPGATPLSVSMPIQIRSHPDQVIAPWLWNLLPDDDAVVRRWARQFQTSATPFTLLATHIGMDCAGAVRFVRPERLAQAIGGPGSVTWLMADEVAERLRDLHADSTAWLGRSFTGQFSLARFGDQTAIVVERYDRMRARSQVVRVHQEDLCQALGIPPTQKYQNDGGPTPQQIVGLLRKVMSPADADNAVERFLML